MENLHVVHLMTWKSLELSNYLTDEHIDNKKGRKNIDERDIWKIVGEGE